MFFRFIHDYCWMLVLGLPGALYLAMENLPPYGYLFLPTTVAIVALWLIAATEALE